MVTTKEPEKPEESKDQKESKNNKTILCLAARKKMKNDTGELSNRCYRGIFKLVPPARPGSTCIVLCAKSAVARYHERAFLGFSFTSGKNLKIKLDDKFLSNFKDRIRTITRRSQKFRRKETGYGDKFILMIRLART
ncbi:hypothetical protein D4S03_01945 [bacterium]|nr:MAG: hypothetical protein D4S03_01945 [bacterium]